MKYKRLWGLVFSISLNIGCGAQMQEAEQFVETTNMVNMFVFNHAANDVLDGSSVQLPSALRCNGVQTDLTKFGESGGGLYVNRINIELFSDNTEVCVTYYIDDEAKKFNIGFRQYTIQELDLKFCYPFDYDARTVTGRMKTPSPSDNKKFTIGVQSPVRITETDYISIATDVSKGCHPDDLYFQDENEVFRRGKSNI